MRSTKWFSQIYCLWIVVVLVMLVLLMTPHAFASSHCKPLLLLIEGGSLSTNGPSMEKLAENLGSELSGKQANITVANVDHKHFVDSFLYFLEEQQVRAAKIIQKSNHWPIVIVGHSLGAQTAYDIARKIRVSLLVTLDGVSFWGRREHLPHPGKNMKWIDIDATGNAYGPDWGGQGNANRSIINFDSSHYDVEKMFNYVKNEVVQTLRSCPRSVRAIKEKSLCDVPGVSCNVIWEMTDGCPTGPRIKVKFFELDENKDMVASWREYTVRKNGTSNFNLSCKSPGHWICYGAANRPRSYWGSGLDGQKGCTNCCAPCRDGRIFETGALTCRN